MRKGLLLAVFIISLIYSCKEDKYTFDFLPAPAIRYERDTSWSNYVNGQLPETKGVITSVLDMDSIKVYSLNIKPTPSSTVTTFDTVLFRTVLKEELGSDRRNYTFDFTNSLTKEIGGFFIRAWDTRKQTGLRKQVHIADLGIKTYSSVVLNAQGNKGKTPGSAFATSSGKAYMYFATTAADTAALKVCDKIDFVFWYKDATSGYQFHSVYQASTFGTGTSSSYFFASTNIWPTRNHCKFLRVNSLYTNINTAISSADLSAIDMSTATETISNVVLGDIILFETAAGKRGLIYMSALSSKTASNTVNTTLIIKVQK